MSLSSFQVNQLADKLCDLLVNIIVKSNPMICLQILLQICIDLKAN